MIICGRYTATKYFSELIKLVGVLMAWVPFFGPCYNIAPTQFAPVIYHERHQPAAKFMRWGVIWMRWLYENQFLAAGVDRHYWNL